ncbi:MAG: hypothetical protein JNL25_02295 [Rhodospirillaceae bacterium]|nr:hypothetical protein [Rhodospirillaceae bacterium]
MTSFDFDVIGDAPRPPARPAQKSPPEKAPPEKAQSEKAQSEKPPAPDNGKAADRAA